MVTAGAAHAFGVCTAKWLRAAARAPYFRYMAKQQNPIQRHEVLIARGYICTLPKRGVERSERADHYGIRYKPIGLVRELQAELGDRKVGCPRPCEHSHACVECGKEFYNAWEHGRGDVGKVCSNICQAKRQSRERESKRGKRPAVPS